MVNPRGIEAPRCIALAGPTASGKTAAAFAIAGVMEVEIISVDSALVYRGMTLARPSRQRLSWRGCRTT